MQTGSGKTYTMGTGYTVGGSTEGVTPQVMATIFKRIDTLKHKADFQLRVSFIEVIDVILQLDGSVFENLLYRLWLQTIKYVSECKIHNPNWARSKSSSTNGNT